MRGLFIGSTKPETIGAEKSPGFLLSKGYNNLMRIESFFPLLFQWAFQARNLFLRVGRKEREKRRRMTERRGIFVNLRRKLSEIKQRDGYFGIIQIQFCLFWHHHTDIILPILALYRYSLAYFGSFIQIQPCLFWRYTDTVLPISTSTYRYSLAYCGIIRQIQMQSCLFWHCHTDIALP